MTRDRKHAKCPECCPDYPVPYAREYERRDDGQGFEWVWACQNCGHRRPVGSRKVNVTATTLDAADLAVGNITLVGDNAEVKLTEAQARTIDTLLDGNLVGMGGRGNYASTGMYGKRGGWEKVAVGNIGNDIIMFTQDYWLDRTRHFVIGVRGGVKKYDDGR